MKKVKDVGEQNLIKMVTDIIGYWGNDIIQGNDDVFGVPAPCEPDMALILNSDMLVSTTDVPKEMPLFEVGRKAVVMACSDLFVKGVVPKWAIISLGVPKTLDIEGDFGFKSLIKGIVEQFSQFHIEYIGGDLNESKEIIIDTTIMGYILKDHLILRKSAIPGDLIYTTGDYGLNGLALKMLLEDEYYLPEKYDKNTKNKILKSVFHVSTDPLTGPAIAEQKLAHASADSSDGLIKTLIQISEASGVGIELNWAEVPKSPLLLEISNDDSRLDLESLVLSTGEEFTHLFCIPPENENMISQKFGNTLKKIGKITPKKGKNHLIYPNGLQKKLEEIGTGFNHFV